MSKLTHLSAADFHRYLVKTLTEYLHPILAAARPGHCLRITTLPSEVADQLCHQFLREYPELNTALLHHQPSLPWHKSSSFLIELRNRKERPLLIFVPPGEPTPDSLEISTFNEIPLTDIARQLRENLEGELGSLYATQLRNAISHLRYRRFVLPDEILARYFATILINGLTKEAAGGAIYQLGLVPHFGLFEVPDQVSSHLDRNVKAVQSLANSSETLLARIHMLGLIPGTIQEGLYKFLNSPGLRPEAPREWGREIAITNDERIQNLSFDSWNFPKPAERRRPKIFINELSLAERKDDSIKVFQLKRGSTLPVRWELDDRPLTFPDLAYFRIQIVSTEGGTIFETPNVKPGVRASRSHTVKNLPDVNIPDDLYFIRVRAYDHTGEQLNDEPVWDEADPFQRKINESENVWFYSTDEEPPEVEPPRNLYVRSFLEAKLLAQFRALDAKSDPLILQPRESNWVDKKNDSRRSESIFGIQYDIQNKFSLPLSTILKRVEEHTLELSDTLGRWRLELFDVSDPRNVLPLRRSGGANPSQEFLRIRAELFAALRPHEGIQHLVETRDLLAFDEQIKRYATIYVQWLDELSQQLNEGKGKDATNLFEEIRFCLDIDVVEIRAPFGVGQELRAQLVAPTHPLRLLWLLQQTIYCQAWVKRASESERLDQKLSTELRQFMRGGLSADNLPLTLSSIDSQTFIDSGPLTPFWQLYLPTDAKDSRAVRSRIERLLGVSRSTRTAPRVSNSELIRKVQRYLVQHPYVSRLKINVFNPGDASALRDIIETLEMDQRSLTYEVHLFADEARIDDIGSSLSELTNPVRQVGPTLDPFTVASRNTLFPKLKYSRGHLAEFLKNPHDFEAHISILFDTFGIRVDNARLPDRGRSSYFYGLIQDPYVLFEGGDGQYAWRRQMVPIRCADVPLSPGAAGIMSDILSKISMLQASLAAVIYAPDSTPVVQLNLHPDDKELLHQIHATSDWVLTVDRNLGLEYFDNPEKGERPIYLLDFTPEFGSEGSERLLLTTRSTKEVIQLIGPAMESLGLERKEESARLILEMLRSLSGRLALKLQSSPSQIQEALGLALARLFLEQYELLSDCIVVPLDAHTQLFAQPRDSAGFNISDVSLQRSDLVLVSCDPTARAIEFHIIEVKCRQELGSLSDFIALKQVVREQLEATETTLRKHFDPTYSLPDRIDRPLKSHEMVRWLEFYLQRALRYRSISSSAANMFADFLESVDNGYTLIFKKSGLIFDFGQDGLTTVDSEPGITYQRIGHDYSRRMINNSLATRLAAGAESLPVYESAVEVSISERESTTMSDDESFGRVRKAFSGRSSDKDKPISTVANADRIDNNIPLQATSNEPKQEAPNAGNLTKQVDVPPADRTTIPPKYDILVADNSDSPQFGILGEVAGKSIALDLNGCNTTSIFGVQGGGKSYTIGTVVEMAVQWIPGINVLPSPLASVIFHFHESQDYPPEFTTMVHPNTQRDEIERLNAVYGAKPQGLKDVILLTSADKLADRQREFPSLIIEPIYFNPGELSIKDWLFLMGAVGNPSMYVQQINVIMRRLRGNLTIASLRAGIDRSNLSDSQKELALTRLSFAQEFIRDDQHLRDLIRPGRLIIVDIRDELIQKDQALGLFVVMLNVFSGAGQDQSPFNKLIVFDEAHKYITNSDLTTHVVEAIREMRHKGVSIILASQDPPSLPGPVIELSSVVILHKFNSPKWLSHLQKSVSVLGDLSPEKMSLLRPGEAYLWANKASDPIFTQHAVKIQLRPRATMHGGVTKKAIR